MTSSRVVRGTKGRIVLYICAIVVITGIIACYNNTLSQLDDVRKASDQCHQQQENLSTQLQVIFDYKQRLEKSLKTEKAEHQQTKKELEGQLTDEKAKHDKTFSAISVKFSSLKQHYDLLQTQHDDFKEECSKIQQHQLHEMNAMEVKLKEIQGQLKQSISEKENSLEQLKAQYLQLQVEKENLEKQVNKTQGNQVQSESDVYHLKKLNSQLQQELDQLTTKCFAGFKADPPIKSENPPTKQPNGSKEEGTADFHNIIKLDNNVADLPSNAGLHPIQQPPQPVEQVDSPNNEKANHDHFDSENVLIMPNNAMVFKSSSTTSRSSKASLDVVQPLNIPTVTPGNVKSKPSSEIPVVNANMHVLAAPFGHKKLPVGVVPVPEAHLEPVDDSKDKRTADEKEKEIRDDVDNAFPNRYRNNLILNEMVNEDKAIEAEKQEQINDVKDVPNLMKHDTDKDNNALEVFDSPLEKEHDVFPANEKIKKAGPIGKPRVYDAQEGPEYKEMQNDMQLEENDPEAEDDDPDYADHIARQKDMAVRN